MILSYNEVKKHIDVSLEDLQQSLINLGHEVEGVESLYIKNLKVGKVVECIAHPESQKLKITKIDIGTDIIQVICGAPNVDVDQLIVVATEGCEVNGMVIKPTKLAGEMSNGMICAIAELIDNKNAMPSEYADLIHNFKEANIGDDAAVVLGLDDYLLDISLTANRGDCQSYRGLIRDLSSLYPETKYEINNVESSFENSYYAKTETELCSHLSATLIKNIHDKITSDEDKIFLIKHGIKPQNYIVDKTNIVLLKTGIPMHAYDADKINGGIIATVLSEASKYVALDEVEYNLTPGTLVIKDETKIVGIASVMGSNETKITDETKDALLELGCFDPSTVRNSAKNISRKTDASMRGEKGIDVLAFNDAFNMVVSGEEISTINSDGIINVDIDVINFDPSIIKIILGIEVENAIEIIEKFGFVAEKLENGTYDIKVPSWRKDIENDHDFVEEVIRYLSLDAIENKDSISTLLSSEKVINSKKIDVERNLEKTLLSYGIDQVITYSLVSHDELETFNQQKDACVELMMPLSSEHAVYRQSLMPSLIHTAKYNFDHQQKSVSIFEIANTYTKDKEDYKLGILLSGVKKQEINQKPEMYNFYDLKNYVTNLLNEYNVEFLIDVAKTPINEINKYVHAEIIVNNKKVGFLGKKHPNYVKKMKHDVFVCELDLGLIENEIEFRKTYSQISHAPVVSRDLTIIVNNNKNFNEIRSVFNGIEFLKTAECISIYTPDETKTTYTFNLSFVSDGKTFVTEEIDALVEQIVNNIRSNGMEFNEGN